MPGSIGWVGDPSADSPTWLAPYPYPDPWPESGWLADLFPHVLQILHPAYLGPDDAAQPVTWAKVAAARGTVLTIGETFETIDDPCAPVDDGLFDASPEMGRYRLS
ncbi:hypothetical protein [Rhodococcus xishaensis]|uniref:hypothetical protein n=1 Tax=Rhodococcus xishaensis TaxID=2487364 RepID=UPI000FDDA336|nr:hypothetical protein [Rhodococcus xishaensis]